MKVTNHVTLSYVKQFKFFFISANFNIYIIELYFPKKKIIRFSSYTLHKCKISIFIYLKLCIKDRYLDRIVNNILLIKQNLVYVLRT